VIRARYVGETPFGDTREVFRRVRELAISPKNSSPGPHSLE
jgi:hypothetical protein